MLNKIGMISCGLCYIKFFWYFKLSVMSNSTRIMTSRIPQEIAKELCNLQDISNFHE